MLRFVRQEVAGCVGGAPRRGVVVVRVALEGERLGGVTGEGLEISSGFAALGKE